MHIITTDEISYDMLDQLTDLVLDSNEADGTGYTLPDDADYYFYIYDNGTMEPDFYWRGLPERYYEAWEGEGFPDPDSLATVIAVYLMGETYNLKDVAELSAFTSPKKRRRGFFRAALDILMEELRGFRIRFAVYPWQDISAVLAAVGAAYDHDEIIMELSLDRYGELRDSGGMEGLPGVNLAFSVSESEEEAAEEGHLTSDYGECSYRIYESYAYIYGIRTYERYLRKGYACAMLAGLFDYFIEKNVGFVRLEVSSSNIAAAALYKKLGFETVETLGYYYI